MQNRKSSLFITLGALSALVLLSIGCDPAADAVANQKRVEQEKTRSEVKAFEKTLEENQKKYGIEQTERQKQTNRALANQQVTGRPTNP